jgi:hypothetical protein
LSEIQGAPFFRIFHVSACGELILDGVTVQRDGGSLSLSAIAPAIFNRGITSLQNSSVTNNNGELGAIRKIGTLHVFRSIIADNSLGHLGGGIRNEPGENVLVENSTIAHNASSDGDGISNEGSLVVRNSAIISNRTDQLQGGGGLLTLGPQRSLTVLSRRTKQTNTVVEAYSVLADTFRLPNSTIREKIDSAHFGETNGGGILNDGGMLQVQNAIVAGNILRSPLVVCGAECFGTITSLGNNLIGDPSGCAINLQPSDLTGDPGLGSFVGGGEDDLPGRAYYRSRQEARL